MGRPERPCSQFANPTSLCYRPPMLAILERPEMRRHALPVSVPGYEKMGELGLIDESTELLRGVIFEKMSKSPLHSGLTRRFIRAVAEAIDTRHFISSEQPLRLADSCPEPDLAVVEGAEEDFMTRHPGTARLVIEISLSTETLDREKAAIYAEAGIPEYWIVLPARNAIEVFTRPVDGIYSSQQIVAAETACVSSVFPRLTVRLTDWLT